MVSTVRCHVQFIVESNDPGPILALGECFKIGKYIFFNLTLLEVVQISLQITEDISNRAAE